MEKESIRSKTRCNP